MNCLEKKATVTCFWNISSGSKDYISHHICQTRYHQCQVPLKPQNDLTLLLFESHQTSQSHFFRQDMGGRSGAEDDVSSKTGSTL